MNNVLVEKFKGLQHFLPGEADDKENKMAIMISAPHRLHWDWTFLTNGTAYLLLLHNEQKLSRVHSEINFRQPTAFHLLSGENENS
jgi:hypothetical protein